MSMTRSRRASSKMPGKYSSAVQVLKLQEQVPHGVGYFCFEGMVLK